MVISGLMHPNGLFNVLPYFSSYWIDGRCSVNDIASEGKEWCIVKASRRMFNTSLVIPRFIIVVLPLDSWLVFQFHRHGKQHSPFFIRVCDWHWLGSSYWIGGMRYVLIAHYIHASYILYSNSSML
ncbi:hypothetical protein FKM82_026967 [Ascaphus truei]